MTDLEIKYRKLMRAYPPHHRTRHEDEIISTLLDVAADGQRRPKLREAAAIVTAGVGRRIQDSSELKPGLRLAGIVALAATFAVSTMAIVLAAPMPLEIGLAPAMAWLAVIAASIVGSWATSTFRVVPSATITLVMIAAGSSAMGLRRSTLVPAAVFLILSAFSRPTRRAVRLAAPAIGIVLGSLLGTAVAADVNQVFQNSDSPWVYVARWDIVSDLVPANSTLLVAICLLAAVAGVLFRRLRYAVAATILATPLTPAALFDQRGLTPSMLTANNLAVLSIVAATLTLAITLSMSLQAHRRMRHTSSRT